VIKEIIFYNNYDILLSEILLKTEDKSIF